MRKKDVKTFGDAIAEGLSIRYEREMAGNAESAMCSDEHKAAMLEIVVVGHTIEQRMGRRRLLAILVAAALLLLAGCTAFVYRNEIGAFVENVYEEYINVELPENDNYLDEIESVYILSYIPEGYELSNSMTNSVLVRHIYSNEDGELLVFDQSLKCDSNIGLDNNGDVAEVFEHNNIEIYVKSVGDGTKNNYLWYDDNYVMTIIASKTITKDEIVKIIDGIE